MNTNDTGPNYEGLSRRTLLTGLLLAPPLVAFLAACGDTTKGQGANPPDTTARSTAATSVAPSTTAAGAFALEHPTGADDVILRLGYVGGFVRPGYAFTSVPTTLISGDRRLIRPGVTTAIFPGPLLPALDVRTITEAGIQTILDAAGKAGLLATPPDYTAVVNVADVPDTILTLDANGVEYVHQANALGYDDPVASKARQALSDFCDSLGDIEALVGAENLGEEVPLVATAYRLQATPLTVEDLAGYTDPKPTEVAWPAEIGVALADATTCVRIEADKVGTLFADANELTFFTQDGTTFMVAVVAELPGDTC